MLREHVIYFTRTNISQDSSGIPDHIFRKRENKKYLAKNKNNAVFNKYLLVFS